SSAFGPFTFGCCKKRKPFPIAPLHLHHVGHSMDGTGKHGLEVKRATRRPFGSSILAVLLKAESVHGKDARIARRGCVPRGQDMGDPISQHAPATEEEVERMRHYERENVAWPVGDEGAISV